MKTTHRFFLLAAAMIILWAEALHAQIHWEQCMKFPDRISTIYFFDADLGFIAVGLPGGNDILTPAIYRTLDGGKSWMKTSTPEIPSFGVNEIYMESKTNGWAAGDHANGRIWHTTDGGGSWNAVCLPTTDGHLGNSIRRTKQGLIVSDFLRGDIELSTDEGVTFQQVYAPPKNDYVLGMDFTDSLHGAAATTFRRFNKWAYTADGGLTWHESNYGTESWSIRAIKKTSTFFAIPEGLSNSNDYLSEIMRSDDNGQTWNKINTLPFRGTSDVEIAGNVLYIQTGHGGCSKCSYPDGLGIYRSIDSGATWHGIGGPDYWADTRFAVIPSCYGTTIFCSDVDNNLYKAFDTLRPGIANINNPHLAEIIPPAPMKVSPCTSTLATAVIRTAECYKLVILSEKAVGPDSAHFKISKDDFPVIVTSKYHTITISPSSQIDSGTFDAFLHISGYFDYGSFGRENFDTLLPLHLESIGLRPQLSSDKNAIIFSSIDPCTYSTEELLTLRNKGCDTLTVLSGPGELPSQFTYDSITFPFQLAPDEAKTIRFHFTPDSSRLFTANTIFKAEQRGKLQTLVIPIQGEKQKVVPHLEAASSEIFFQNVSMCSPSKDIPVVLKNMGCDTIEVISESDTLSSEFSLDTIALPLRLAPQESLSIMAHFHPSHPGSYYGNISFLSRNGYSKRAISVLLIGSAESSGPMLTVVNGNLEFPLRSTCEPPDDSVITVLNSGCDSMSIISAPGSLPPEFTMDSASFPIPLAAGESHAFHFHFHPTSSGVFSARPKFVAEHFGMQRTVISYIGGKGTEGTAMLRTSPDAIVFPAMTICSESETQVGIITNSGCDTLIVTDVILAEGGSISKSAVDLPMALAPGDSLKYKLLMTPQFKGAITGQISVVAHSAHGTQTSFTSITPISGTVGSGSRTLELSANQIDLGANSLCALRDTSVVIGNSGCDTITITNVTLEGTGFHLRRSDLPIILAPEATAQIGIESEADTMGGKQEASATMTVTSDADNTILPIQLSQKFKLPAKYAIALSGGIKSALPGDTIMLEIRSDADLRGVTTIDLDLELNSDLLGIFKAGGANSATYSDGHLQIRGNPDIISDHGTIATLAMCVYVTKAHSTPIAISAIHLNAFDPSFEECTATASVSGESPIFTTIYPCGGRTLSEFLRNTPAFRINSSYPNPSHDEITLAIESEREQDITITLFDANGKLQLTKVISVTSGKHSVALDLHAIPSGSYITNMTGIQTSSTVRFVKME